MFDACVEDLVPVQERRVPPRLAASQLAASDPTSCADELAKLALGGVSVQRLVAQNPSCPQEVLVFLASCPHVSVRAGVAANMATPPEVLAQLALERSCEIRRLVAGNPSAPEHALRTLRLGAGLQVLEALAKNPACPLSVVLSVPAAVLSADLLRERLAGQPHWEEVYGLHPGWEGTLGELMEAAALVKGDRWTSP